MAVTVRHSVEMASLYQSAGIKISSIGTSKPIAQNPPIDKRKFNRGGPSKLTPQDKDFILDAI